MIATKKRVVSYIPLFFYVFLLIPFLYQPYLPDKSRAVRYVALLAVPMLALSVYSVRQAVAKHFRAASRVKQGLIVLLLVCMAATAIVQHIHNNLQLIGLAPDYLGLFTWLACILAALVFQSEVQRLMLSKVALLIFGSAMLASIIFDRFFIWYGVRIPGVMFQSTTLAMYANVAIITALYHFGDKKRRFTALAALVFVLAAAVICLCQSRIGNVMFTITLLTWAYRAFQRKRVKQSVVLALLAGVVIVLPFAFSSYFVRFQSESVATGIGYRLDLYKTSARDLVNHNIFIGNGPGSLPAAINNPFKVPEDIAETLKLSYRFNSTHDLFFDFTYYFGSLATISFIGLIIWSVSIYFRSKLADPLPYFLLFCSLLINALFNVTSLELTSLFFVVVFGLTGMSRVHQEF
jgi:O-antigen ligase